VGAAHAGGEEHQATKRTRTAANDASGHHVKKAAARKLPSAASASVKPARRKRA
jgi:hypothetical protein